MRTRAGDENSGVERALVITDIVESTPLVCRLGDRDYQELIEGHDRRLVDLLDVFGGEYVRSCGDGAFVAFTSAQAALRWALDVQRLVAPEFGIKIRIGAHFGSVRVRDDGYVGKSIHITARIAAMADGDEIQVSRPFLDSAHVGWLGPVVETRLRGLDETTELLTLTVDGDREAPNPHLMSVGA